MIDIAISEPTIEPLSRAQAKLNLRMTATVEDALVDRIIVAAREHAETFTGRAFVFQTRRALLDFFPPWKIELRAPLLAVQSVEYLDSDGVLKTLATDQYRVEKHPPTVTRGPDVSWPSTLQALNAVRVNYTAGMLVPFTADAATDVLSAAAHGFADAEQTMVSTIGGTLPAGLAASTNYHVRDATDDTLKLAATAGGAAIDITSAGTPPNVLGIFPAAIEAALQLLVQYHEQRNANDGIREAAEALLWPHRILRF